MAERLSLPGQVRRCLRLRHHSIRTERACVEWLKRFILHGCRSCSPARRRARPVTRRRHVPAASGVARRAARASPRARLLAARRGFARRRRPRPSAIRPGAEVSGRGVRVGLAVGLPVGQTLQRPTRRRGAPPPPRVGRDAAVGGEACSARGGGEKRMSCHTLRHSFAAHPLESGYGIRRCFAS